MALEGSSDENRKALFSSKNGVSIFHELLLEIEKPRVIDPPALSGSQQLLG